MAKSEIEEVNLLDLLAGILATLKKNLKFTILFPILGIIVALGVSVNSRDLFESSLLIETSLLSKNECKFLFDQLNKARTVPGLTPDERSQLAGFAFNVIQNDNATDAHPLNESSLYLEVTARVYNQGVFPALEKSMLRFVNENPSVVRHRTEREKYYNQMIAKIESEMVAMDQVKKQVNGSVQATYLNPSDLYGSTVQLYREKVQFEIRRDQIKSVHLVKGFDSLTFDAKMNKAYVTIIGFALGFVCLFLFLFLQFFVRYFTVYETTH